MQFQSKPVTFWLMAVLVVPQLGAQSTRARDAIESVASMLPDTHRRVATNYLCSSDSLARFRYVRVLARDISEGDTLVSRFLRAVAVADASPYVRAQAAREGAKGVETDAALYQFVRTVMADSSASVRAAAIVQLALRRTIARDSGAFRYYWTIIKTDVSSRVRADAIVGLLSAGLPPTLIRDSIVSLPLAHADSMLFMSGLQTLRRVTTYDTTVAGLLAARISATPTDQQPSWLLAEHQKARDVTDRVTVPWFMREAPPAFRAVPAATTQVRFFVFGDWGNGHQTPYQRQVAAAIRRMHGRVQFHFGVTTGDNFYQAGVESPRDPRWRVEYESTYGALGVPIFGTLGNHDYGLAASPAAEIVYGSHSTTWKMPATHYTFVAGPVQIFIIDTESLTPWQLRWLDSALAESTAPWKIVVGHLDLYSNRRDGSKTEAKLLVPLLKRHNVQLYLNGHYHTLQHHQVDGIDYITSGAAGRGLYNLYVSDSLKYHTRRKFANQSPGFAALTATRRRIELRFIDHSGRELYHYTRSPLSSFTAGPGRSPQ